MKYKLFISIIFIGIFLIFTFGSVNAVTPVWGVNLSMNATLPALVSAGGVPQPSVFYKDSSWYLLSGSANGFFYGFAWNGTQWNANSTINATLLSLGAGTMGSPSVFYKDSSWYLIYGANTGKFYGYVWNGSGWATNLTINASLPTIGTYTTPDVFYKDSSWYLLTGINGGRFYGYAWNGTNWLTNLTINSSLPYLTDQTSPYVFYKDSSWYLISGVFAGIGVSFAGFAWNGTNWLPNSTINLSLPLTVSPAKLSVFYKDSSWFLIAGNGAGNGNFFSYSLNPSPPISFQGSVNQTYAGQATNFTINVNDAVGLHPNGTYIFSTNNTGVWVNDSAVNFTSTPSWANVTKVLNSTRGIPIGYKWYINNNEGLTNSTQIYTLTTLDYNNWAPNSTITTGLPSIATYSKLSVFYKDSSWYMIAGNSAGTFYGYAWNGTGWATNLTINASLPSLSSNSAPYVFYKDSSWYLISGKSDGKFYGYAWNGTGWATNLTINSSLPSIGANTGPCVFYKDGTWYLISGAVSGNFFGYDWNGTGWETNLTINASLPNVGIYSAPAVFYKDSSWYLITGDSIGTFGGYVWNGTGWETNLIINASLPNVGPASYTAPSVFYKDSSWYIISGTSGLGNYYGYSYYVEYPPKIISLSYTPNSYNELDPNVNVSITANIFDIENNFDSAIIQWKNSSSNLWTNVTTINISVNGSYTLVNGSFTLPSYEDNITFRVIANDTFGEYTYGDNYTLQSFWDCTWSVSPSSLEEVAGFYEDKFIGNITLINTGDVNYTNNNCSISFTMGSSGWTSTYYSIPQSCESWNNLGCAPKYLSFDTNPVIIDAKSNKTISINASFPYAASSFTETPTIKITSSINDSITKIKTAQVSSTLVIAPPNPLLYQKIATYPSTYLFLTPGNFSLEAYVRNLGYDNSNAANTTAYNVSFNWTLPEEISSKILEGNETSFYEQLNTSSKQYNNLTIALTSENLASMPKGTFNIAIYSYGYENESGNLSLISNSGNQLILNEIIPINFLCYDTSDGICVSSCGIGVDPDCKAPETPASNPSSGGGSVTPKELAVATSAAFQLVRGKQNEVPITFENKDSNKSLNDLVFSVSGNIAKYIDISPKTLSTLGPSQKTVIILTITSPTYIELGKQELIITMKAKKGEYDYTDSKSITLEIHELSIEDASILLNESRDLIDQLNEANISSDYLNQLLNQSETEITNFNLEVVRNNSNIIKDQVKYALDSNSMIIELSSSIKLAEKKGIDVSESSRLLELAQLSLQRGEYEQAYTRLKDSQLTYALEVKGEVGKLGYYLKTYPKEISLGVLFLFIFSFGAYNLNKLRGIKKKIKELKREERILNELIRVIQNECFKEKKIGMNEYETAMKEYNRKLSNVVQDLIELETKRAQILRFTSKTKRLKIEREKIISLIKEMQMDYLKKKKIETRTYELKMDSFNKRLAEIEEKFATLETKKALKGIGVSLKIPKGW